MEKRSYVQVKKYWATLRSLQRAMGLPLATQAESLEALHLLMLTAFRPPARLAEMSSEQMYGFLEDVILWKERVYGKETKKREGK